MGVVFAAFGEGDGGDAAAFVAIWTRSPGRKGPRRLIAPVGSVVPLLTG